MKRYVVVGTGGRAGMYIRALSETYADNCNLVGLCDANLGRAEFYRARTAQETGRDVTAYAAEDFDRMLAEQKPDCVVVITGPDRTHSDYIIRSMRAGMDVITEKPMTTDADKCMAILKAREETGQDLRVTFNYRYSPPRTQVKQLVSDGSIGEVLSANFSWYLDTRHGADYFRRWHRRRDNSGSLLVHKSTHHFDLVNWWIDDVPEEVFAHGTRRYYTPERAAQFGLHDRAERCHGCPASARCPFFLDMDANEELRTLYRAHEDLDGYFRDRCVFSDEIDIWDTMSLSVKYRRGAVLSYLLHAYSPVEGYRIALNGMTGRIEHFANENTYISGDGTIPGELAIGRVGTTLIPEFSEPMEVELQTSEGGHGGGDELLLADLFAPRTENDPLRLRANHLDGAYAIMIGVAAAKSIDTGSPVRISSLMGD